MRKTVAWYFRSDLRRREDLKARLDATSSSPWMELDSDSGQDSISRKITSHAWLRIYAFGMGAYVANLTVEADGAGELDARLAEATKTVVEEIFTAAGARDVDAREEPYAR